VIEAAELLGVGRSTMYELVHRGEVASIRLGRKVLITRSTLEALLGFTPPTPAELAERQSRQTLDRRRVESGASQLSLLE